MTDATERSVNTDCDVVIIGGGPTGLNLALTLCTNGVDPNRIKIIEKRAERKKWCKAAAVHPRSMELFYSNSQDLIDSILSRAEKLTDLTIGAYDHNTKPLYVPLGERIESTFPYITGVEQWYIEECLENELYSKFNLKMDRNLELVDFKDNINSFVDVTIKNIANKTNNNLEHLRCKYLVGCDGARSAVRQKLDIAFPGDTLDDAFVLVETHLEDNDIDGILNGTDGIDAEEIKFNSTDKALTSNIVNGRFKGLFVRVGVNGFLFGIALPENKWYIGANITPGEFDKYGRDEAGNVVASGKDWNEILRKRGLPMMKIKGEPIWRSSFFISNKCARYFSNNNHVFLCGDACHVHSPLGGQGMNMGLQDAQNLGWKLALVLKDVCNSNLLNSYECERRSIDESILQTIHGAHARMSKVSVSSARTFVLSQFFNIIGSHFAFLQSVVATQATQLGYSYRSTRKSSDTKYYHATGGKVDLVMDYWIRPTLMTFDIIGNILKRRHQNITRVLRGNYDLKLLASGDRVPNFHLMNADSDLESTDVNYNELYKLFRKFKFVVLLCEGCAEYTEGKYFKNEAELSGVKKDIERQFGNDKICKDFIRVVVIGRDDEYINKIFAVKGQCLILIRNDHYIGLRSEPISLKALKYYLVNKLQINKIRYNSEYDKLEDEYMVEHKFDWIGFVALSAIASVGGFLLNKKYGWTKKLPTVRFSLQW